MRQQWSYVFLALTHRFVLMSWLLASPGHVRPRYFEGLVQACNNSSALELDLLQSCTKTLIYYVRYACSCLSRLDYSELHLDRCQEVSWSAKRYLHFLKSVQFVKDGIVLRFVWLCQNLVWAVWLCTLFRIFILSQKLVRIFLFGKNLHLFPGEKYIYQWKASFSKIKSYDIILWKVI